MTNCTVVARERRHGDAVRSVMSSLAANVVNSAWIRSSTSWPSSTKVHLVDRQDQVRSSAPLRVQHVALRTAAG